MRCQFCGWDNPEGKTSCEKCNKPLVSSHSGSYQPFAGGSQNHGRPTDRQAAVGGSLRKTVREGGAAAAAAPGGMPERVPTQYVCPMCGYPMEHGVCASCGYEAGADVGGANSANGANGAAGSKSAAAPQAQAAGVAVPSDARKTMRPKRKGEKEGMFSLTPISEDTGQPEGEAMRYEGNEVLLNRDNTDPRNKTITSHGQAEVVFADGKWTIRDKSQLKTTFVQAGDPVELKDGAIILLGNQLYRFDV